MKKLLTILLVLISFSSFAQFEAGEYINSDTVKKNGVNLYLEHLKLTPENNGKIARQQGDSVVWGKELDSVYLEETDTSGILDKDNFFWSANKKYELITPHIGGGTGDNVYMTNVDSDISGYKKTSYTNDIGITSFSAIASADTVLVQQFLFDGQLSTSILDAGGWIVRTYCNVSSIAGVSKFKYEFFVYDDADSTIFSFYSDEINNTAFQYNEYTSFQSAFNLGKSTYRLGVRVYFLTTLGAPITGTFRVGDGETSYINTPIALRHERLRDKNGEENYLHINRNDQNSIDRYKVDSSKYVTYTNNSSDLDMGANSISTDTVKIDGVPLLLNTFKQGNLGGASNIFYSTGASSQPASGSVNQVAGGGLLNANAVVKYDGTKLANSIITEATKQINIEGVINTNTENVIVASKNKYRNLLSYNNGSVLKFQDSIYSGGVYISNNGYGFGNGSLQYNSGANSNGFGRNSLYNNSGANSNGFGLFSLQNNSGANSNGFGHNSLYINSGANSNGFGYSSLYNNTGGFSNGFGYYSLYYNNYSNVISIGHQSTTSFIEEPTSTKSFTDLEITANTITFTAAHGFGSNGSKVNLKFKTVTGTAPTGLVNNSIYQFTITSTTVLTLSGIGTNASLDFQGSLTKNVDITNSIAIGTNVNATKQNQIVLGSSSYVETLLFGNVGINQTNPSEAFDVNGNLIADVLKSRVATGTPPLVVASSTKVDSLNVGLLDGKKASDFQLKSDTLTFDATKKDLADLEKYLKENAIGTVSISVSGERLALNQTKVIGGTPVSDMIQRVTVDHDGLMTKDQLKLLTDTVPRLSGTLNYLQKVTGTNTLGNSSISATDSSISVNGAQNTYNWLGNTVNSSFSLKGRSSGINNNSPFSIFNSNNDAIVKFNNDGRLDLSSTNSYGSVMVLNNSHTATVNQMTGHYAFSGKDNLGQTHTMGYMSNIVTDPTPSSLDSKLYFYVMKDHDGSLGGWNQPNSYFFFDGNKIDLQNADMITLGNISAGTTSAIAKFQAYQNIATDSVIGSYKLISSEGGLMIGNSIYNKKYTYRDSDGKDWLTSRWHDALDVDGVFSTPQNNTRTWWERDPYNNIQSWGTNNATYFILNGENAGFGTSTPAARIHSQSTTTQARLGYDENKYTDFSTGSTGNLTIDPTGDTVKVVGAVNSTGGFSTTAKSNLNDVTGDSAVFANMKMTYGAGLNKIIYSDATGNFIWGNQSSTLLAIAGVTPSTGYLYYNGSNFSYASGGSAQWTADTYGINYSAGKVGIGIGSDSGNLLTIGNGSTNTNIAIKASSLNQRAISAISSSNTAIEGQGGLDGVYGVGTRYGVQGASPNGNGVRGSSTNVAGVSGTSTYSYGGEFSGLGVNISSGGLLINGTTRISSTGTFTPSNGASGSFTSADGKTITVTNGIITGIN